MWNTGSVQERTTAAGVPALLSLVGGIMLLGGSFADWFGAASLGVAALSASGIAGWEGKLTAACGGVAILLGTLLIARRIRAVSRALTVLAATGALAVIVAASAVATAREHLADAGASRLVRASGVDPDRASAIAAATLRRSGISVSIEAGAFLVLGGGALVVAAGAIPLAARHGAATVRSARAGPPEE
jgi:hypothetical protein